MVESWLNAAQTIVGPDVLLVILLAAVYGIFVGAIPGLTATMAVALIVPITFFLDDVPALAAIVTLEACSIFAGDIPTTLVRMPGTPSSAAYVDDAYSLTRRGLHERALGTALVLSVGGGLFGALVLITAAPQLAKIAFAFTSYEYFWLYVLGLSCAAIVSHGSRVKGALALVIGLLLSMVGMSDVYGVPRFTFGSRELYNGINFIPAMIGLFGVSEVLRNALTLNGAPPTGEPGGLTPRLPSGGRKKGLSPLLRGTVPMFGGGFFRRHWTPVFGGLLPRIWRRKGAAVRSSIVGTVVGMIPGAGADIGAWISYAVSKRFSRTPEEYGQGSLDGLADATTANNAALAGAWIPALVFGIPGDSVTAIVIGVLLMKNIQPGPAIFTDPHQAVLVRSIFATFLLANLILLPLGFLAIRAGSQLVRIPRRVLMPVILLFCILGALAVNGSEFDIWIMLAMGVLGFILEWNRVPLGPVVLGIILGGKVEQTFVQNMIKSESLLEFFGRPIAAGLGIACLLLWLTPLILPLVRRALRQGRRDEPGGSLDSQAESENGFAPRPNSCEESDSKPT